MSDNTLYNKQNLIWIDLEMTGLDPDQDTIIEIACIVTNKNLDIIAEGPVIAIHQSDEILDDMNNWCKTVHAKNGLIDRVKNSTFSIAQAEQVTLEFLSKWVPKNASPICGNSISHDKRFLYNYMPKLANYFHYRQIDVSTIKELIVRWRPELLVNIEKKNLHLALDDIKESIKELIYYRQHFIKLD